jgi:hypothetical protein
MLPAESRSCGTRSGRAATTTIGSLCCVRAVCVALSVLTATLNRVQSNDPDVLVNWPHILHLLGLIYDRRL